MLLGGFRIEADRYGNAALPAPPLPRFPPGLSPSGGGVGGKTFRPMTAGALESRGGAARLVRLLCTRFVAA
jgi:hypothetical protein